MNKTFILLGVLVMGVANAQHNPEYNGRIGINIIEPKATLHINSIETDKTKGILLPKQTGDELKTNSANLTAEQDGVISYITEGTTTPDGIASNVHFKGLHRFNHDNASWVRLEPSGLEKVRHNGKIGYRLVGMNPEYYSGIGNNAIDLSIRNRPRGSSNAGAIGDYSIMIGSGDTITGFSSAEGKNSIVIGSGNAIGENAIAMNGGRAVGKNSFALSTGLTLTQAGADSSIAIGYLAITGGEHSIAIGSNVTTNGDYSVAMGQGTTALNEGEIAIGILSENTDAESLPWEGVNSGTRNHSKAQLFSIGGGHYIDYPRTRGNALIVLRDGSTGIALKSANTLAGEKPEVGKPTEKLDVNGDIRIRGEQNGRFLINGTTCTNVGTITYNESDGNFYGCTGAKIWKKLNND